MVMLAYNFMSLFRQVALRHSLISGSNDVQHTLNTLRLKLFAKAGYIGMEGCATTSSRHAPTSVVRRGVGQVKILRLAGHIQPCFYALKNPNGKSGIRNP